MSERRIKSRGGSGTTQSMTQPQYQPINPTALANELIQDSNHSGVLIIDFNDNILVELGDLVSINQSINQSAIKTIAIEASKLTNESIKSIQVSLGSRRITISITNSFVVAVSITQ